MAAPVMPDQQNYGAQQPQQSYAAPGGAPPPQQSYAAQPQPTYAPAAAGAAPAVGVAAGRGPAQDWKVDMFDCFSPMDTCCMGYWCPCVLFGKTQQRIKDPTLASYDTFNPNCIAWGAICVVFPGFQFILSLIKRGELREHYNIDGSGLGDCLRTWCCLCCTIIQEEKEALLRNAELGYGTPDGAPAVASAPAPAPTMQYATPEKQGV